ncbi:MAG: cren protein [Aeropyrum sp.]|nr:cren protein [Aeropyrum sp.]MCE4615670.1 cren protein [Aeropyrum sp.]
MEAGREAQPPALAVRVQSLEDLVRLASVNAARMAISPIYRFRFKDSTVYMIQTVYKDYYRQYGVPILYYYAGEGEESSPKYILVKVDEEGEKVEKSDGVKPGWLAVPVVNLSEKPSYVPDDIV